MHIANFTIAVAISRSTAMNIRIVVTKGCLAIFALTITAATVMAQSSQLSNPAVPGVAGHAEQSTPYAGQEQRAIKALSDDEVKQYSAGAGMGHARAAELNRYPGPMHVLELADKLELSSEQRTKTAQLMDAHKMHARELGAKVIAAERELDELFRSARANESEVAAKVRVAAAAQGEFRLSHLETHRRMRALLTAEQVARYEVLRGYAERSAQNSHDRKH